MRIHDQLISKRTAANLLIFAVVAFAAGIAGNSLIPVSEFTCSTIILGLSLCIFIAYKKAASKIAFALLILLFFGLGILYTRPFLFPPVNPDHIHNQLTKTQKASLIGILAETPKISGYKTKLVMRVEQFLPANSKKFTSSTGLVKLTLNGRLPRDLLPGQRFMVRAKLSKIRNFNTPGAFNFRQHYANKSIWITGWIRSSAEVIKVEQIQPPSLLERLRSLPERARYQVSRFINNTAMSPQNKGLYKALLIGDRSEISPEILEYFKKTGCFHLLAISGMHIGMLAFLITASLGWLLKRSSWLLLHSHVRKIAVTVSLLPLICYASITGFQPPVVRALIMSIVFIMAILLNSQWSIPTNIAIAALLILLFNPASLYSVSFQLSFAAVCAIALFIPRIRPYWRTKSPQPSRSFHFGTKVNRWVLASLVISVAAMSGTAPLLLYYFNRISLLSPISTLFVAPLLCFWTLPLGLFALFMLPLFPQLAQYFLQAGAWGLTGTVQLIKFLAGFEFVDFWLPTPSIPEIFCYFTLLYVIPFWCYKRVAVTLSTIAVLLLVSMPVTQAIQKHNSSQTEVTFLDVGTGNSCLLELPQGHTILINGGGPHSDRFDVGEWIIAPFLWKKRIDELDALVITQPLADHYNGLSFILERFKPPVVWINGTPSPDDRRYGKLLNQAEQLGLTVKKLPEPDGIIFQTEETSLRSITAFLGEINRPKKMPPQPENRVLLQLK